MKNLRTTDSPAPAETLAFVLDSTSLLMGCGPFSIERGGHQTPCAVETRAEREFSQAPSQAERSKTTTGKSSKSGTFNASLSKGASERIHLCSAATAFSLARNSVSFEIARKRIERARRGCPSRASVHRREG